MSEHVIGIDLGTTNSCVAVMQNGSPVVIPNKGGYKTTPSVVALSDTGRRLVGHIAKRQAVTNADGTAYAVKRLIGRKWESSAVTAISEGVPYVVAQGPHNDIRVELKDNRYSLPEISAFILQEMRLVAEQHLEASVQKAVVTVPAYFNDGQRQATKDAGRIAGLDIIRIINEPTAAALAYGFGKELEGRLAVFDLGGGTFDISILDVSGGVFEVASTAGDTFLGGEDFDHRIVEWLIEDFYGAFGVDLRTDMMALQRLKDAAEKLKCDLSVVQEADINLPFLISDGASQAIHLQQQVSRQKLEALTSDLIERTLGICERALSDAQLEVGDISDVVLVGGMTRMPKVQQRVAEFFQREPSRGVHPDEVVALGAAIQGAALLQGDAELLLLDVTPHALGIMVAGGHFHELIEPNTTVPASQSHIFTTTRDNQTSMNILVMQGDAETASGGDVLGQFKLSQLREAPRGAVEVEVTFEISADGIVSVTAQDLETELAQSITVTASSCLTESEISQMTSQNAEHAVAAKQSEAVERARQEVERLMERVESLLPALASRLDGTPNGSQSLESARKSLEEAAAARSSGNGEALSDSQARLTRVATMLEALIADSLESHKGPNQQVG